MSKFYFTWNHKKTRGFLMISGGYKLINWLNSLHIKGEIWRRSLVLLSGYTSWKSSKYGVFSGPYFPVFTGKYRSKKSLYFDAFRAVLPFPQGFFFFFFFEMQNAKMFCKRKGTKYMSNGIYYWYNREIDLHGSVFFLKISRVYILGKILYKHLNFVKD